MNKRPHPSFTGQRDRNRSTGPAVATSSRAGCGGQAAAEYLLVTTLVVLAIVAAPDNSIERLMQAIESRYQSLALWMVMP